MNMRPKVDLERASKLWHEGVSTIELGEIFGRPKNVICGIIHRNRALFPPRKGNGPDGEELKRLLHHKSRKSVALELGISYAAVANWAWRAAITAKEKRQQAGPRHDTVVRTTFTGAKVTMPRVVFIDGEA